MAGIKSKALSKLHPGATGKYLKAISTDPCVYCLGLRQTFDHVTPRCRSKVNMRLATGFGRDHWTNLAPSCNGCNQDKGHLGLLLFLLRRLRRGPHHR